MNIYIPYSLERDIHSRIEGNLTELHFAIRSIEKYLTGWEEIILIGHPPKWFKGRSIPAEDMPGKKEQSIYRKMLWAADDCKRIPFIRWDDDHFLLKRIAIKDIKYWYDGNLRDFKGGSGRYRQAINATIERFPLPRNFDVHAPIIVDGYLFNLLFSREEQEICVKTVYCESCGYKGEQMIDLKIKTWMEKEEIKRLVEDRLFFSTGTLYEPMLEFLLETYPEKSSYE